MNAGGAPHIETVLTMREMLTHAFTHIYFNDETAANDTDTQRCRLCQPNGMYHFDIHMQGERETVFFDP